MTSSPPTDPLTAMSQTLTPKRAVSYLRVSTREQARRGGRDEGFSIPAQRAANKRKALAMGAIIAKEFVEGGVSATTTRRPALQSMLTYLEEETAAGRAIDYVIVHKLDRLVRNRYDDTTLGRRFDELGVRLASTSENIDQTPGGLLLHGIMASIAEFYSANLSNEVKKGMDEKVRSGGCIGRAPLGYRNTVTHINDQEARTVVIDNQRASLVTWAFRAYATGQWTLKSLAAELEARGLTTVPTAKLPEKPLSVQSLGKLLRNTFYIGQVTYRGTIYQGNHQPLISREVFDTVQLVLAGHANGERTLKHPHYLKSTIYCGICGSRLIITNATPRNVTYQYFVCLGRHSKKQPDCTFRATLPEQIEDEVARIYQRLCLYPAARRQLEQTLHTQLTELSKQTAQELDDLTANCRRLERQREKLLQAHYADAIPLETLKTEQARITHELTAIQRRQATLNQDLDTKQELITQALDLAQHTAHAYRRAPDHIRRLLNQTLFDKIYITPDDHTGRLTTTARPQPPFDTILKNQTEPTDDNAPVPATSSEISTTTATDLATSNVPQTPPAGGHQVASDTKPDLMNPSRTRPNTLEQTQNTPKTKQKPAPWVHHDTGLSMDSMVGVAGFEPTTSSSRTKRATKLRHTPCAAGDSIVGPWRWKEIRPKRRRSRGCGARARRREDDAVGGSAPASDRSRCGTRPISMRK